MMKMDEVATVRECCRMNSEGQDGPLFCRSPNGIRFGLFSSSGSRSSSNGPFRRWWFSQMVKAGISM